VKIVGFRNFTIILKNGVCNLFSHCDFGFGILDFTHG
jgi:hypothetical protein